MQIKLFVRDDCPRCPAAKRALAEFDTVEIYDVDDVEGLAEASFHSVLSTPSVLVIDSAGREVGAWRGEIPSPADVRNLVAQ